MEILLSSGDIVFTSGATAKSGDWGKESLVVNLEFSLYNEAAGLHVGDLSLSASSNATPYGQGWSDSRSPFTLGKQYRVTITEL